jgi:hypothetical protein
VGVYVKIDAQRHMTGVRGVGAARFQRTENTEQNMEVRTKYDQILMTYMRMME